MLTLREVWTRELIARLRLPLPWLKLLIAICPLLGLLGTVTGMIQVFDSLALTESSQARAMADGVAQATLPTLCGMAVAVVGLLFVTRLEQIIRREDQRLHDRMARAVEDSHA
jgi:biopolymer transport protein ExbB